MDLSNYFTINLRWQILYIILTNLSLNFIYICNYKQNLIVKTAKEHEENNNITYCSCLCVHLNVVYSSSLVDYVDLMKSHLTYIYKREILRWKENTDFIKSVMKKWNQKVKLALRRMHSQVEQADTKVFSISKKKLPYFVPLMTTLSWSSFYT